ncbi:hypothetical protein B0J18DRAFT_139768 [Chaetomium sp. MPI-SDFR-AT-0129]|nr:hypothetical protein B0J18DRAFT_139768 [Chaetomium sp. MPI-SDFR-AT-0129]
MAQTPQQRRANLKFAKGNEARMGKSEDQIKKRVKDTPKSPISPIWLGTDNPFSSSIAKLLRGPGRLSDR